jgi:23S rRNA (cytosine1962-C5)-methyltransferase
VTALPETWQAGLEHRRTHFDLADPELCVRLLHTEDNALRCDRFGPVCWFYEYETQQPTAARYAQFESFAVAAGARHWHMQGMHDRGRDPRPSRHAASMAAPDAWHAVEDGQRFELRAGSGQSPGLFLDQRDNRAWVRHHASDARILNLFAYTGGFGVAALAGDAAEVVQVDVSRAYLNWARVNAGLNGVGGNLVEYSAVDARRLVAGCQKRGRRFDGIICDPPSFGRGRGRNADVFRIEHDLPELVQACRELLDPGGWMLVSCNYEGWSQARFEAVISAVTSDKGTRIEPAPGAGKDFCGPGQAPLLKSLLLRKCPVAEIS